MCPFAVKLNFLHSACPVKLRVSLFHEVEMKLYQRPQEQLTIMEYMDIR